MPSRQGRHDISSGRQRISRRSAFARFQYFCLVLILLLTKTLVFIGLISAKTASVIDLTGAFPEFPPILVYLCFQLVLLSFAFLFRGKLQIIYLIVIDMFLSFILIIDLCSFRECGSLLSLYLPNLKDITDNIFTLVQMADILFLIDIPILIFLYAKYRHEYRRAKMQFAAFIICIILSLSYLGITVLWSSSPSYNDIAENSIDSSNQTVYKLSPLGYHIYDIYSYISGKHI